MSHAKHISVAGRLVGRHQPVFVIAEAGINHDGSSVTAHALVDAAADAHADAIKFQIVDPDESYVPGTPSYETFSARRLPPDAYAGLVSHARDRGILMFATPADRPSLDLSARLQLPAVKISSGLMTNTPLIERAALLGVPLLISTGGSELWEVARLVGRLEAGGFTELALLHCVSAYPTPPASVGVRAISTLQSAFPHPIGYSDHTMDGTACICAVALGASVLEKHLTLDRARTGADHAISAEPIEFVHLVQQVRAAEQMLMGEGKHPAPEEAEFRERFRRRIVAVRDIAKGERLTEDMLGIKRPVSPGGLAPEHLPVLLGRRAVRAIRRHDPVDWDLITDAE